MATTSSPSFSATNLNWTLIADGSTIAKCGIEVDHNTTSVFIAIGQDTPEKTTDDYLVLNRHQNASIVLDLQPTDNVYALAPSNMIAKVRTYQVTR